VDRVVLDDWLREAARTHHVGLSEPFDDLHLARARTRDAERALGVALRRRHARFGTGTTPEETEQPGAILRFEDVDLVTWLLASRSTDAVAAKARQQLGHLLDREDLAATAAAYLTCNLDVRATAQAMFLHPNSVRYRLRRIEELLGAPITSAVVVANLYLALHDQLAEPHQGEGTRTTGPDHPPDQLYGRQPHRWPTASARSPAATGAGDRLGRSSSFATTEVTYLTILRSRIS
jgi:purine catabolism regulator